MFDGFVVMPMSVTRCRVAADMRMVVMVVVMAMRVLVTQSFMDVTMFVLISKEKTQRQNQQQGSTDLHRRD